MSNWGPSPIHVVSDYISCRIGYPAGAPTTKTTSCGGTVSLISNQIESTATIGMWVTNPREALLLLAWVWHADISLNLLVWCEVCCSVRYNGHYKKKAETTTKLHNSLVIVYCRAWSDCFILLHIQPTWPVISYVFFFGFFLPSDYRKPWTLPGYVVTMNLFNMMYNSLITSMQFIYTVHAKKLNVWPHEYPHGSSIVG